MGDAFARWDSVGHWLEYTVDVPAEGYYHLALVYCSEMDNRERSLEVNGEPVDPEVSLVFPSTGGWANSSDDWRLLVARVPELGRPLLIKLREGENVIRLTNTSGGGVNLDYLAVCSPDVEATRQMLVEMQEPRK